MPSRSVSIPISPSAGILKHFRPARILLSWLPLVSFAVGQELPWDPLPDGKAVFSEAAIPEQEAVVLFKRRHIRVYGRTTFFITKRVDYVRIQILGDKGLGYADVEIPYHKGERVALVVARTVMPSGEIVPVAEDQVFDKVVHKVGRHTELRVKAFAFPRVEKGSILEYQIVTNRDGFQWIEPHTFEEELPVLSSSLEFAASNEISYTFAVQAFPGLSLKPELQKTPQEMILRWQVQNLPPLPEEDFQPPIASMTNRVVLKPTHWSGEPIFVTWNDAARIYNEAVLQPFLRRKSKVKNIVAKTTRGMVKREKVDYLYGYVLNTIHPIQTPGILPSATADELLDLGRGDVTDRNLLLIALLRQAKIEAYPALVASREYSSLPEQFPCFSEFDRVICNVELDGSSLFLDAARPGILPGNLPSESEGIPVLVIRDNKAEIVKTGESSSERNRIEAQTNVRWASTDGAQKTPTSSPGDLPDLTLEVKSIFHGHEAEPLRAGVTAESDESRSEYLSELVKEKFSELEITSVGAVSVRPIEPLELEAKVTALPTGAGDRLIVALPTWTGLLASPLSTSLRLTPLMFSYPYELSETGTMATPVGYRVEEIPSSISLETKQAEFQLFIQQNGTSIEWRRRFVLRQTFCPVLEYPKLREFLAKVVKWDTSPIVFCPQ